MKQVVISAAILLLACIGLRFMLSHVLPGAVDGLQNSVVELVDSNKEPITKVKTYEVIKCDQTRVSMYSLEYAVVLKSEDENIVLDTHKDYEAFLPYFGREVTLEVTWHGKGEDTDGFVTYKIIE